MALEPHIQVPPLTSADFAQRARDLHAARLAALDELGAPARSD